MVAMELTVLEETVLSLLGKGKVNAKSSKQIIYELQSLGIELGSDPTRELRGLMHSLRLKGFAICASNDALSGYFLAETPDELWDYIQRELERLREQAKPIAVLRQVYRQWVNEQVQRRLTVLTEEGKQFLRSLITGDDFTYIRKFPDRAAQKIYTRAVLVKMNELQDWIGNKALDWLKSQGITEESVREFIKEVLG
ncbi:MAG: hypothetical protein RMK89_11730 [Armatimonadota bacterium]|nr:hypothetical protein [Armatimonadota bacterium]MDW8144118.1 hypothetical protein [Armatimonadota bacterium]